MIREGKNLLTTNKHMSSKAYFFEARLLTKIIWIMRNFTLLFLLTVFSFTTFAASVVVTSNGNSGAGTLRDAIENASTTEVTTITFNGDMTITLSTLIFIQERIDNGDGTFSDGESREIIIDGGSNDIIIDGNEASNIFSANSESPLTLKNLTIQNAKSTGSNGGAISAKGGLTVIKCDFINNDADTKWGGAIFAEKNELIVENCEFIDNTAKDRGGAIYANTVSLYVVNTLFENNQVNQGNQGLGSAICNLHGFDDVALSTKTEIVNCTFIKNKIVGSATKARTGGTVATGIWNAGWAFSSAPQLDIYNSVFWGNSTDNGSGAPNGYATELFTLNNGSINLNNSAFENVNPVAADNIVEEAGRELAFSDVGVDTQFGSVSNCFDALSSTSVFNGITPFVDYNSGDFNLAGTVGGSNNPLINSGVNNGFTLSLPNADLAGNNRIAAGTIDIGAYEYGSTPTAIGDIDAGNTNSYYSQLEEVLYIDSEAQNNNVEIYSLSGANVLNRTCGASLSLSGLGRGMYIIRINNTEVLKIVK